MVSFKEILNASGNDTCKCFPLNWSPVASSATSEPDMPIGTTTGMDSNTVRNPLNEAAVFSDSDEEREYAAACINEYKAKLRARDSSRNSEPDRSQRIDENKKKSKSKRALNHGYKTDNAETSNRKLETKPKNENSHHLDKNHDKNDNSTTGNVSPEIKNKVIESKTPSKKRKSTYNLREREDMDLPKSEKQFLTPQKPKKTKRTKLLIGGKKNVKVSEIPSHQIVSRTLRTPRCSQLSSNPVLHRMSYYESTEPYDVPKPHFISFQNHLKKRQLHSPREWLASAEFQNSVENHLDKIK